jgi:60 kDa SS-A/Ro ribonucleoprotein
MPIYTKSLQYTQTEQADPRQVLNNAGGYTFTVDKFKALERFLILGAEGGTYYCSELRSSPMTI